MVNLGAERLQLFMLLMMRVGGIMVAAPIFSHRSIPRRVAVGMALGLTVVLLPIMSATAIPQAENLVALIALCLKEVLVGVFIGFVFSVIFVGVHLAGSVVGYQIGFAMANIVDPDSPTQVSILGEFWFLLATLIFLFLDGHHIIITGLVASFKMIPLGLATPTGEVGDWLIKYSSFVFVLAVKFAGPVMLTVFLADVAMGILARTMPQMNIFIVGFPLKIFAGLLLMGLSLPTFAVILRKVNAGLDQELVHLMKLYHIGGVL